MVLHAVISCKLQTLSLPNLIVSSSKCHFTMDEPEILETDLPYNGDHRFLQTRNGLWSFDPKCDVNSQRLFNVLKCSMLKLALDGADKAIMDRRMLKPSFAACKSRSGSGSEHGEERRLSLDSSVKNVVEERRGFVHVPEMVHPPSGSYNPFPLKILTFIVAFFALPIRLSYFSFMLLFFPSQTLKNVPRMCSVISKNVISAVSRCMQAQKSVAVNVGFAFFRSIYVCTILLGILASGFILSRFVMRHLVENPIQTTETLNFDYTKPSPVAFVPLMPSSRVSSDRAIPYNRKLQLAVSLTAPESEYKHMLGVFQVRVEFLSANGSVKASSSHPCMLRYKSRSIHFIETFLRTAPLIAGLQSETQVLNIKMSEHIEGLEPTACLKVILEQRAEFQNGAGIPQIYAASLVLESELPRLKRFVWNWRRTIFVWTSLFSFLAELMFILVFFRPIIVPRGTPKIGYSTKKFDHSNIIFWQKSS